VSSFETDSGTLEIFSVKSSHLLAREDKFALKKSYPDSQLTYGMWRVVGARGIIRHRARSPAYILI